MIDRTGVNPNPINLHVEPARTRQTPDNSFGAMMKRGAQRTLGAIGGVARSAASFIPGGLFLTAVADLAVSSSGLDGMGGFGNDKWALLQAQERLQEEGMANSLRLLALQRKMHQETQVYTTISNVMKCRHDMAKSAINNIR